MPHKIGVIILSHNSRPYLDDLFFSLGEVKYPDWRILFIDNNSSDNGIEYLKEKFLPNFSNLEIMELDKNIGFAGGNNVGLKYFADNNFDCAYLLNQDTVVEPDFLEKAAQRMDAETGSVQSLIFLHNQERVNTLGNAIHFLGFGYCYGYGWDREKTDACLNEWRKRDPELNIAYASGAGALFNLRGLAQVGFFDEDYFMYHEDLDLGWRLRLAGYRNVLAPDSVIYHKYEFLRSIKKYYWMERNRFITIARNYSLRGIVMIAPAFLLMELGLFIFSFFSGWWKEKLKVYGYFLYPTTWRKIAVGRKRVQSMRQVPDKDIGRYFVGEILFQGIDNPILRRLINPLLALYWSIAGHILRTGSSLDKKIKM